MCSLVWVICKTRIISNLPVSQTRTWHDNNSVEYPLLCFPLNLIQVSHCHKDMVNRIAQKRLLAQQKKEPSTKGNSIRDCMKMESTSMICLRFSMPITKLIIIPQPLSGPCKPNHHPKLNTWHCSAASTSSYRKSWGLYAHTWATQSAYQFLSAAPSVQLGTTITQPRVGAVLCRSSLWWPEFAQQFIRPHFWLSKDAKMSTRERSLILKHKLDLDRSVLDWTMNLIKCSTQNTRPVLDLQGTGMKIRRSS